MNVKAFKQKNKNKKCNNKKKKMEQYLIYQVRINLIQQSLVSFNPASDSDANSDTNSDPDSDSASDSDPDRTESATFSKISGDIITLCQEIMNTKNDVLISEFIPQIENLCVILNTKKPFM